MPVTGASIKFAKIGTRNAPVNYKIKLKQWLKCFVVVENI